MTDLRRVVVLSLVSVPVATELVIGELLFLAHVVFLVETLGFAWGLLAFILIWAALGLAVLTVRDTAWPCLQSLFEQLRAEITRRLADLLGQPRVRVPIAVFGMSLLAAAVGSVVALGGGEIGDWLGDHRGDAMSFLIVVGLVLALLLVMARAGRSVERWVRNVGRAAGPATRSLAVVVTMAVLGPALGWFLFRLLGYEGRSVYALTLLSAPVFGVVWVPVYALGVWKLLERLF